MCNVFVSPSCMNAISFVLIGGVQGEVGGRPTSLREYFIDVIETLLRFVEVADRKIERVTSLGAGVN